MVVSRLLQTALLSALLSLRQVWTEKVPIIFVYNLYPRICNRGLPLYINHSLEQALATQSQDTFDVILASNFAACPTYNKSFTLSDKVVKLDTTDLSSSRTREFAKTALELFMPDGMGELWQTSALRFFNLEDIMIKYKYKSIIHVEADNMLYGPLKPLLPILRQYYVGIAATPLTFHDFITASVMWVSDLTYLDDMNTMFLNFGRNETGYWKNYLNWLRPRACCKYNGYDPDEKGYGIKPFAVNEMSMLTYYRYIRNHTMHNFPVVPARVYPNVANFGNISMHQIGGASSGVATGLGVWDSNSYGQYLGGTHQKKGRNKGFSDGSHIIGQVMRSTVCRPRMECSSKHVDVEYGVASASIGVDSSVPLGGCYTIPKMICEDDNQTTPIWNLHIHAKSNDMFVSSRHNCTCTVL